MATVNISFQDDLLNAIDTLAKQEHAPVPSY